MARSKPTLPGVDQRTVDRVFGDPASALRFVKDVALLCKDCAFDARVPRRDKWILGAVGIYLLSPIDLIPDAIPVFGQADDPVVATWAVRQLIRSAGAGLVRDLWRGDDDGLAIVLGAAGIASDDRGRRTDDGGHGRGKDMV